MFNLTYNSLAKILNAKQTVENLTIDCSRACIDSRLCQSGDLFVALNGARVDGHNFVEQAYQKGAVAALVEQVIDCKIPQLIVADTLAALQQSAYQQKKLYQGKTIALTGSYGKTTVKQMIASILTLYGKTHASQGNQNNTIGLPLTLLALTATDQYAVLELGINQPGEMQQLIDMIEYADVALVTNVTDAHVQGLGNKNSIAKEKGLIYKLLKKQGIAILNTDCEYSNDWQQQYLSDKQVITFAIDNKAMIYADNISLTKQGNAVFDVITPAGKINVKSNLLGKHQVFNSLAAAALAHALEIPLEYIKKGLETVVNIPGRVALRSGINHSVIIDDTYNASNFQAVKAAMELLAHYSGKRIFIFGGIAELGDKTEYYHQLIGETAKQLGIDYVYGCGQWTHLTIASYGDNARQYDDKKLMLQQLVAQLDEQTTVLVKGSRITQLNETVVPFLLKEASDVINAK